MGTVDDHYTFHLCYPIVRSACIVDYASSTVLTCAVVTSVDLPTLFTVYLPCWLANFLDICAHRIIILTLRSSLSHSQRRLVFVHLLMFSYQ